MKKLNRRKKKYIRPLIGLFFLILGGIFMLFPFIPLGYVMVFAGLFLLAHELPFLKKPFERLKKKDKKNRTEKVEKSLENLEKKMEK